MIVLFIVGLIVLVAGIIFSLPRVRESFWGERDANAAKWWGTGLKITGALLIALSLVFGSLATIPAGHRGVVVRFGATTGRILEEGLQAKIPFFDGVVKMSVQTEKYEAAASAASHDLQDVNTTIALNWRLNPSMAAEVYRTLGLEFISRIAAPAVQETIKQVTAQHNAEDLILKRDEVKAAITENLLNRLRDRGITVEAVSITNFEFSATFTAAIEAKVSAYQAVLEAENKLERVKVEAQQRKAQAEGEAAARIAQAEGEAQYIRIVTDAQIAANEAIAATLTPEVLQYILLDRLGEDIKVMVIPSGQGLDLVLPEP